MASQEEWVEVARAQRSHVVPTGFETRVSTLRVLGADFATCADSRIHLVMGPTNGQASVPGPVLGRVFAIDFLDRGAEAFAVTFG